MSAPQTTTSDEIRAVLARARQAQRGWRELGLEGRRAALQALPARLLEASDALARLMSEETGKPLAEAQGEVKGGTCDGLERELDEIVEALAPEEVVSESGARTTIVRSPHGVCVVISPWNFPVMCPRWQILPALLAGNTVVVKPSELSPRTTAAFVDVIRPLLPAGVLEVVQGAGEVGATLVAGDVDLVAFTGSLRVGANVLATATADFKRVVLELGGKNAAIVLPGADAERAAETIARSTLRNAGQTCASTDRIYVTDEAHDEVVAALIAACERGAREMGPLINERQRARVAALVDDAVAGGAERLWTAPAPAHPNGYPATILAGVTPAMRIDQEEVFGPVVEVRRYRDEADVVAQVNRSGFGMTTCVFGDEVRATRLAADLDVGVVQVNRWSGPPNGTPWVGARKSGYGFHGSRDGHRQFAQARAIVR